MENTSIKIKRILCATDLSVNSDQAVRYALALARSYNAKLSLIYCADPGDASPATAIQRAEVQYAFARGRSKQLFEGALLHFLTPLKVADLDWEGLIVKASDIGETITSTAAQEHVDLIVMRSRRRPHRAALLGSTAEAVCRSAPCPVLVTHSDEREWVDDSADHITLKRVLVAYDFSDYSELALRYALSLSREYQAELHLQHVLPRRTTNGPEIAWYPLTGEGGLPKGREATAKSYPGR